VLTFFGQNVMGMKVFAVDLDRNVVEVRGANGAGKSSFMEGLPMLIGGKRSMPDMPLRKGETEGFVGCVLGDTGPELLVKRRLDGGKPELEVRTTGGFVAPEPQTILNAFKNDLSFNPGAFCKADPKAQAEMVRKLVGLDFTDLEQKRKQLFDERTQVNRLAKSHAVQRDAISVPEDTPLEPISVNDLLMELKRRQEFNRKNETERQREPALLQKAMQADAEAKRISREIADLEDRLVDLKARFEHAHEAAMQAHSLHEAQKSTVAVLEDLDETEMQEQISGSQAINANVERLRQKAKLHTQAVEAEEQSKELTAKMEAIDCEKEQLLADAKWPVPGLSLGEDCVLYDGIPVSQVNSANRLRIGIAVCAAMHPTLMAIRIENASLLDAHELEAAKAEARERDFQLWLEVVAMEPPEEPDAEIIFIADGAVVSGAQTEMPTPVKKPRKKKESMAAIAKEINEAIDNGPPFDPESPVDINEEDF
jgi:uncharacterized protein YfcZ (UPF0381/DUF406 family)